MPKPKRTTGKTSNSERNSIISSIIIIIVSIVIIIKPLTLNLTSTNKKYEGEKKERPPREEEQDAPASKKPSLQPRPCKPPGPELLYTGLNRGLGFRGIVYKKSTIRTPPKDSIGNSVGFYNTQPKMIGAVKARRSQS